MFMNTVLTKKQPVRLPRSITNWSTSKSLYRDPKNCRTKINKSETCSKNEEESEEPKFASSALRLG